LNDEDAGVVGDGRYQKTTVSTDYSGKAIVAVEG